MSELDKNTLEENGNSLNQSTDNIENNSAATENTESSAEHGIDLQSAFSKEDKKIKKKKRFGKKANADENASDDALENEKTEENEADLEKDENEDFRIKMNPQKKKTIFLAMVSLAIFTLTFSMQFIYTNYLVVEKETEIVNWKFVTGDSDAIVSNAETYNQAESSNKISKPVGDSYMHCIYKLDPSSEQRVLEVITEYSPVKILYGGEEIYNNGYGETTLVGNCYNEVILPQSGEAQNLELYLYYPFSFNLKADITDIEASGLFSLHSVLDNFEMIFGFVLIILGLMLAVLIFCLMFRSKDIITLSGLSLIVSLSGLALFFKALTTHFHEFGSPLFFSAVNSVFALIICCVIVKFHSLLEKKRRITRWLAVAIVAASALAWIPHLTVIKISLVVSAVVAVAAFIMLFQDMEKTENLFVDGSSAIRIVGVYAVIAYIFNAFATALGIWKYSMFLFVISMVICTITLYAVYARKIAQKNLIEYTNNTNSDDSEYLFNAITDIISIPDEIASKESFIKDLCSKTYLFLIKSKMLSMPNEMVYAAAIRTDEGFDEICNTNDGGEPFDYKAIAEVLSGSEDHFSVGSSFFEIMISSKKNDMVIIIFDNVFHSEKSNLNSFVSILYRSANNSYFSLLSEKRSQSNLEGIFINLAKVVEEKLSGTGDHLITVSKMTKVLAEEMGFSEQADIISRASMIHDIGKVSISSQILKKSGKFTPEERTIVKNHVISGYNILSGLEGDFVDIAKAVVLEHHENYDGTGYLGKKGNEISIYARIVKVADVFDALVSKRYYKDSWSYEDAINYIFEHKGTEFDPDVVDAFLRCGMKIIEIKEQETV